ncbi:class I tRNA ligase family protein, partial [candidate division WWE3 bacterium]|nr:class I tRNA ligase family protein [candidate division WWE3 bacterium]
EVVNELAGSELLELIAKPGTSDEKNLVYENPFGFREVDDWIIPWEEVSDSEGTGIVHIAPSAGKEDFELSKQFTMTEISQHPSIDDFGLYVEGFGKYTGQSVFDVRSQIYDDLKEKGLFYKTEQIFHSYPHCWRCKHELVFRTTKEWFIKADEIRPLMKEAAAGVNWMPEHAGKRMQDWLNNMGDWPISRKRYWGLALPFYENEDKTRFYVVGSKEELKELALNPKKVDDLPELHRPWIDEIELDGAKIRIDGETQSGVWRRVLDVGDCWLDAGIVPFSTLNYLSDKGYWEEWYPFELITEYVPQVKLWFYATLFMSVALQGKAPWQNVLATGFLVDEKGKAMHKSAGNAIAFDEAADNSGADPIRWLYLRERSANRHGTGNLRFGYNILNDVRRRFLVILLNSFRFFVQNATLDGFTPTSTQKVPESQHVLDKWVLSRFSNVLKTTTSSIEEFDSPTAAETIERFVVNDLSQWYIRRSRDRVGPSTTDEQDKQQFYEVAYFIFDNLTRMLAPFVPFMSESIYQSYKNDDDPVSVHLTDWPTLHEELIQNKLENEMDVARSIVEKIHARRKAANIKLRQPLAASTVTVNVEVDIKEAILAVIRDEVNVKNITLKYDNEASELDIELETEISEELRQEGELREFVRAVQSMRKSSGLTPDQRIYMYIGSEGDEVMRLIDRFGEEMRQKLLVEEIVFDDDTRFEKKDTIEFDGFSTEVSISKV